MQYYFWSTCWFSYPRPLVACSHREVCKDDWMSSQGFADISDVNCCPLNVIFELVYCWNSLTPQSLMNGRSVIVTVLQQQLHFSLFVVCSLIPPFRVIICTLSMTFFPPYCLSFIPSSHHRPFQSRQEIWVKFPSSESGSAKICCVFIKTRRRIIHHISPPSGPFSSISCTESDRKTKFHLRCGKLTRNNLQPFKHHYSCFLHFTNKLEKLLILIREVTQSLHETGPPYSRWPNLSSVHSPSKWSVFGQKRQGYYLKKKKKMQTVLRSSLCVRW